jgi:hypothetical protein
MDDLVDAPNGSLLTKGGISISHSGQPGEVMARMFISNANRGYSAAINFIDPQATASSRWHGNGLRFRNLDGSALESLLVAGNIWITDSKASRAHTVYETERRYGRSSHACLPDRRWYDACH